ncbi:cold-shock protein [Pseudonocardia benzenivorans]|uniref:Cold-shock protein n=1 Tax=Pseudonocardia benzenivorans TaxID=228005 RepID=A0ABW3VBS7_9PSEU|nr:cold-shock protein [Pseudonocardia sp. D17]
MVDGTVTWFDPRRRIGVITLDDGTEVSVSGAQIDGGGQQSLRPGDRVTFTVVEGPDGPHATGVWQS